MRKRRRERRRRGHLWIRLSLSLFDEAKLFIGTLKLSPRRFHIRLIVLRKMRQLEKRRRRRRRRRRKGKPHEIRWRWGERRGKIKKRRGEERDE